MSLKKQKGLTKGIRIRFHHAEKGLKYEMKEVFIGHRTIFSVMGFIVGGILIGRSLWEYTNNNYGLGITFLLGFIIFTLSGIILHEFKDVPPSPTSKDEMYVRE